MMQKEILKCDKNNDTFHAGEKKAGLPTYFFSFVKQTLKASVKRKFDTCILLMF